MSFMTDDHTIFTKDLRNMIEQARRKLGSLNTGCLASPNEKRNDGYNVSGLGRISPYAGHQHVLPRSGGTSFCKLSFLCLVQIVWNYDVQSADLSA